MKAGLVTNGYYRLLTVTNGYRRLPKNAVRTTKVGLKQVALAQFLLIYVLNAEPPPFDGSPWHVSTGNLSVGFIQASPVGAFPRPDILEPPPSVESQVHLKNLGLIANEDYLAWGAIEREPGQWQWKQHDAIEQALHKA